MSDVRIYLLFCDVFCLLYILQVWVLYDAQPVFCVMSNVRNYLQYTAFLTMLYLTCKKQLANQHKKRNERKRKEKNGGQSSN